MVQAIVPGFVSTEAEGKLGAVSKLPEFVPPESMGNFGAGTRLPGFVPPESMGNLGEGMRLPGFVPPESMGNVGVGSKLPEFVPTQTVGNFGVGAKLPGFGSTFRLSSSSPGIVKEHSLVYSQIQKMLRTCTSETLTPRASLPLDVETMHQEEQKQEEVRVDEVLVLDIGSKREELIERCPQQRDVSRSSYGPLEISEFEKYLTGDNDTEQKNNNDGAAILTATLTGHENDGNSVQEWLKMTLRMPKLTLRMLPVEIQEMKNELKIVIEFKRVELKMTLQMPKLTLRMLPVEIQETQKALKTVIQFKRVELNMTLRMPKLTLGIPQVEIQEMQNALKTATLNPVIVMKNMPTLQPKRKTLQPRGKPRS